MKPLAIAGIVLAALGAFILLKGLNYESSRSVMKGGDLKISAQEERAIPPWVGGVAVVGGVVLLGVGIMRRRNT